MIISKTNSPDSITYKISEKFSYFSSYLITHEKLVRLA